MCVILTYGGVGGAARQFPLSLRRCAESAMDREANIMTRDQFRRQVIIVTLAYALALLLGIWLRSRNLRADNVEYETYKDLLSLMIALPAAYLGYCIQRRSSFLQFLRTAWSNLVAAVNGAYLYVRNEAPEKTEYVAVLASLRVGIDELRGIYRNVGEGSGEHGLYPVSPILDIYQQVERLRNFGPLDAAEIERRNKLANDIFDQWKSVRRVLVSELDRPYPAEADIRRRLADSEGSREAHRPELP